jgi:alkyl sulfatase BDS1-like metallo-beta-lactamase superfamily hydrolase
MREINLPPEYEVGQGYGKVSWDVRAVWENYSGWFHQRSTTELYPVGFDAVTSDVVELAGADALVDKARGHLEGARPLQAIHLAEIVSTAQPDHAGAREVLRQAHETLLAGAANFWERAWLSRQIAENS